MSGYTLFARYYDELTENISYYNRAEYFDKIIKQNNVKGKKILDLACGTGSLSIELAKLKYKVIGVDGSTDMLSEAMNKRYEQNVDILFIHQAMENLELFEAQDVIICALDSINHITDINTLQKAMRKISLYLNTDGIFIFDVNSKYKHYNLLSAKTYVYDCENVYCVWQNSETENNIVNIDLDFFERNDDIYYRNSESFSERYYSEDELRMILKNAEMEVIDIYGDDSFNPPNDKTQRLIFTAKKV